MSTHNKVTAPRARFDFNVDVKLTDKNNRTSVQFINMTIANVVPGVQQLRGTWRGAPVFVPSSGGEFEWDGRPGQDLALVYDGPAAELRLVLGLTGFKAQNGGLPARGAKGGGTVSDPSRPTFRGDVLWEIT
jgi:hypothetical protein